MDQPTNDVADPSPEKLRALVQVLDAAEVEVRFKDLRDLMVHWFSNRRSNSSRWLWPCKASTSPCTAS